MVRFLGSAEGKLDRKGRITVPAIYRRELQKIDDKELVLLLSTNRDCIEARSRAAFDAMSDSILSLPYFSQTRIDFEGMAAEVEVVRFDDEGRFTLPQRMIDAVGLGEQIRCLGKIERFEIWNGEAADAHLAESLRRRRDEKLTLAASPLPPNPERVA